jgi:hypothetical protein
MKEGIGHPYDGLWKAKEVLVKSLGENFEGEYGLFERLREAYDAYEINRYNAIMNDVNDDAVLTQIDDEFAIQNSILSVAKDMVGRCEETCRHYCDEFTKVRLFEMELLKDVLYECKNQEKETEIKSIIATRQKELNFYSMHWVVKDCVGVGESSFLILFVGLLLDIGC